LIVAVLILCLAEILSLVAHSDPASGGSLESTSFSLGDDGAGKSAFEPNKAAAPRVV
jgi:hypothetical protein